MEHMYFIFVMNIYEIKWANNSKKLKLLSNQDEDWIFYPTSCYISGYIIPSKLDCHLQGQNAARDIFNKQEFSPAIERPILHPETSINQQAKVNQLDFI